MLVQQSLAAITMFWFWESVGQARSARFSLDLEAIKTRTRAGRKTGEVRVPI
jgi:hypothetical protein